MKVNEIIFNQVNQGTQTLDLYYAGPYFIFIVIYNYSTISHTYISRLYNVCSRRAGLYILITIIKK